VEEAGCRNCLIWAKSDNLARDVIKLSSEIAVRTVHLALFAKLLMFLWPECFTYEKLLLSYSYVIVSLYYYVFL